MNIPTLHVRIISPQQIILDTEAKSISSKNLQGSFDILPQHANFITLVENFPIVIRPAIPTGPIPPGQTGPTATENQGEPPIFSQGEQKPLIFKFPLAIIITTENKVNIYTYIQPKIDRSS